jgi:adenosine 3'-phospho 5'-phosphosulfate transporter B3
MCVGLVFFTLADSKVQPNFQLYGVVLVCLALVADAVIGNVQEKAMTTHDSSNNEMVLFSYSIGFVYILIFEVLTGQIFEAISFCSQVI